MEANRDAQEQEERRLTKAMRMASAQVAKGNLKKAMQTIASASSRPMTIDDGNIDLVKRCFPMVDDSCRDAGPVAPDASSLKLQRPAFRPLSEVLVRTSRAAATGISGWRLEFVTGDTANALFLPLLERCLQEVALGHVPDEVTPYLYGGRLVPKDFGKE